MTKVGCERVTRAAGGSCGHPLTTTSGAYLGGWGKVTPGSSNDKHTTSHMYIASK